MKTNQNLQQREAVILIVNMLDDNPTVHQLCDALDKQGLIPFGEREIRLAKLEMTRKLIHLARKYTNPEETGPIEIVNLFDFKDGEKIEYYKRADSCSLDESIRHLEFWNRYRETAAKKLRYFFDLFVKIHGRKQIQKRLTFDIPKKRRVSAARVARESFKKA